MKKVTRSYLINRMLVVNGINYADDVSLQEKIKKSMVFLNNTNVNSSI